IAVVIGAAFGKIVSSLVDGIIMPVVGLVMGGVDFSQLYVALDGSDHASLAAAQEAAAPLLMYGAFIQTIVAFLIIAFGIFLVSTAYHRLRRPAAVAPAAPAEDILLLREIRYSLMR